MNSKYTPIARLLLRYLCGFLGATGWLAPEVAAQMGADPDLILFGAMGLSALVEISYALAKKYNGAT